MTDAEDHKTKMKDVQTKHRAKVEKTRDPGRGLVLVHTGKGKGKSSSAIGVIVRALGWKQKVGVVQFIKGKWITGERRFFQDIGGVTWHNMGHARPRPRHSRRNRRLCQGPRYDGKRRLRSGRSG